MPRRPPVLLLALVLASACAGPAARQDPVAATAPVTRAPATRAPVAPPATRAPVATREPSPRPPVLGGDISWPSCPVGTPGALPKRPGKGLPLPGPQAEFVVIGLTNGPGFHPNPCLAWEVAQARRRHLLVTAYAFTTLPNPAQVSRYGGTGPYPTGTALGRLRNAAWAQAQVNLASLRRTRLRTPIIWMDVEPQDYLSPWSTDVVVNRAAIRAVQAAYRAAGYTTGFYSSDTPWRRITGGLRDDSPTWVTAGPHGRAAALAKCAAPTFSGGPALLAQWWDGPTEDLDLTCPQHRAQVARFFAAT